MQPISHDELKRKLHYDPDTGQFTRLVDVGTRGRGDCRAGSIAGASVNVAHGYRMICLNYVDYRAHRLALFYVNGVWPKEVDHINGIRSDNRLCNLREVSHVQNQHNIGARKQNLSKMLGVSTNSDKRNLKYGARISVAGKRIYIGSFMTPEEAHAAFIEYKTSMKLPVGRSISLSQTTDSAP